MAQNDTRDALADRFSQALEQGDLDALLDCYAPIAEVWHNYDDVLHDARAGAQGLGDFFAAFPRREITDVRRHHSGDVLIQQHVLHLESTEGRVFVQPICIILHFENGKIRRIDEYVDLSRMA